MRDTVYSYRFHSYVVVDTALLFDSVDCWEAMAFKSDSYGNIESYSDLAMNRCKGTEADALEMHEAMVEYIKG